MRYLGVRLLAGGAAALLLSLTTLSVPSSARQGIERVAYVNAWDAKTRAPIASGLGPLDFNILEDGVKREVLRVAPATTPMPIAIMVDNSQAASAHISDVRKALEGFIKDADGIGPISIVGIADRPTILANYTTDQKQLAAGIGKIFAMPGSGATLLDAIVEISKGLGKREEDRVAMVILSTENIEFSNRHYNEVLEALAKGGAQLHVVILQTPAGASLSDEARNRAYVLDRGPIDSGGTRIDVLAANAFDVKMKELAAILKSQQRVVYSRPQRLIPPKKIEISSAKAGVEMNGAPARGQAANK